MSKAVYLQYYRNLVQVALNTGDEYYSRDFLTNYLPKLFDEIETLRERNKLLEIQVEELESEVSLYRDNPNYER